MSSGFLGTPAIEESAEATRGTIHPDSRDFKRPRQSYYANTYPPGMGNNNDDSNYFLDNLWETVKETGKGVVEEVSSWISGDEKKEEEKKDKSKEDEALKELIEKEKELDKIEKPEITEKDKTKEEDIPEDALISSFQSYLSKPHPIIGSPYSGPVDGKMNPQLASAAKKVESILAATVNKIDDLNRGDRINGKIYYKKFRTTPDDIDNAINIITKHQADNKKVANLTRKEKLLIIYKKIR